MYTSINDFAAEWSREMELTSGIMKALTDASLGQPVSGEGRTLGQIAWHLVGSLHYMTTLGLVFDAPAGGEEAPGSAELIAAEYRRIGQALLKAVQEQWNDATLLESQTVAGEVWSNGGSLHFTIMHQAHHRGQMTVLMRQAGLRVPEVYGPTYDSWLDKGMAPLI